VTEDIVVLDRVQARRCAAFIDPVAVVEDVLRRHAAGNVMLPAEGYMAWVNSAGAYSRSVAMLGGLTGDEPVYGLKLINASVSNPAKGLERAGGVSVLFDPETARPRFMVEAGYLSGLRTAAYTVLSLRHLGPEKFESVSLIGCGALARAHLELIARYLPTVSRACVFDIDPARARELAEWARMHTPTVMVEVAKSAWACTRASRVVVMLTVSDAPYANMEWFHPGTFVAHVSLDDLTEQVFVGAEAVYVDDVQLVEENPRRILGRLMQEGKILSPPAELPTGRIELSGTLGEVLLKKRKAMRPTRGVVVSNPFGMSILDVGMVHAIRRVAESHGLGERIDLVGQEGEDL
jgi:ornithine cyclodeaminase